MPDLRIILWDIDGTLLRTRRQGSFRDYTRPVLARMFGTAGRLVGLDGFFRLPGAFGEDSHDRRDLPALALERLGRRLRIELKPSQLIVVGDTPNDIACALHSGARSVAVATGRAHSAEELRAHNPDAVLPDLSDTELFMRTLASL